MGDRGDVSLVDGDDLLARGQVHVGADVSEDYLQAVAESALSPLNLDGHVGRVGDGDPVRARAVVAGVEVKVVDAGQRGFEDARVEVVGFARVQGLLLERDARPI